MTALTKDVQAAEFARLRTWMETHELNPASAELAGVLGLERSYVYRVAKGDRPITDGFRQAFLRAYGREQAEALFPEYVLALRALLIGEA